MSLCLDLNIAPKIIKVIGQSSDGAWYNWRSGIYELYEEDLNWDVLTYLDTYVHEGTYPADYHISKKKLFDLIKLGEIEAI